MKHLWAVVSALVLSIALVVTGVAAGAVTTPEDGAGDDSASPMATDRAAAEAVALVSTVPARVFPGR